MDKRRVTIREIVGCLGDDVEVLGGVSDYIETPSAIEAGHGSSIAYCADASARGAEVVRKSKARAVICSRKLSFEPRDYETKTIILVPDPQTAMAATVREFFAEKMRPGISPSACVDKDAVIDSSVYIGPNCTIGKCEIGEGTIVLGNVHLFSNSRIGKNVVINPGTVVGSEGILMTWRSRLPHTGGVVIQDNVQIGANVAIQRGMFTDTVIGESTIIGHLVSLGHQTIVGKHCIIVTHSTIGGSCEIGDYTQICLGACVRDRVRIGRHAVVGMGAVVTKDVGDEWVVTGVPAVKVREIVARQIRRGRNG